MRLIQQVEIEGFRSIRRASVHGFADYVPLVGLNGTGKSNVLRALTLFFSGSIDDSGTPLALARDFTDFLKNKRRRIAVRVTFDVSSGYKVRNLDVGKTYAANGLLEIERAWSYSGGRTTTVEESLSFGDGSGKRKDADGNEAADLRTFINSIDFRYLPNHARPADIIAREMQELRPTLLKRVRQTREYKSAGLAEAMAGMQRVAESMFGELSNSVSRRASDVEGIGVDVPEEFAELPIQIGLSAISRAGSRQSPELQGSGTQSFLLLHLLALLDSASRERYFGWRQTHIWAIEEPESFLHAGLQAQFASDMLSFALDSRRQVLCTTHSDEFIRMADGVWLTWLDEQGTSFEKLSNREALEASSRLRITNLPHPLTVSPDSPLVLVEGKTDGRYLDKAVRKAGIRPRWKVISMEDVEEGYGGGQAVLAYIKANRSALRSRPLTAPVIILKDWDVSSKDVTKIDKEVKEHESSCALQVPESVMNPELGRSFRGIERCLPTTVVESVIPNRHLKPASVEQTYPLEIDREVLEAKKQELLEKIEGSDDVGEHLVELVRWLDDEVENLMGDISVEHFSPRMVF